MVNTCEECLDVVGFMSNREDKESLAQRKWGRHTHDKYLFQEVMSCKPSLLVKSSDTTEAEIRNTHVHCEVLISLSFVPSSNCTSVKLNITSNTVKFGFSPIGGRVYKTRILQMNLKACNYHEPCVACMIFFFWAFFQKLAKMMPQYPRVSRLHMPSYIFDTFFLEKSLHRTLAVTGLVLTLINNHS